MSGRLEAVRCEISAVKMGVAVSTAQTQQCVLRECHVRDAEVGIALFAGAAAELHGCELRGNGVGLSLCQGATATLQDCRVHHNTRSGLSVSARARAQITACEVCDNPQSIDGPGDVAADGGRTDPLRAMQ